jgi:hypothetical protein
VSFFFFGCSVEEERRRKVVKKRKIGDEDFFIFFPVFFLFFFFSIFSIRARLLRGPLLPSNSPLAMGSSNGGSDAEDVKPKEHEQEVEIVEEEDKKEKKINDIDVDDLLGLIESTVALEDELPVPAPAPAVVALPAASSSEPAIKDHKLPMAPLGNPKAKHCYDK